MKKNEEKRKEREEEEEENKKKKKKKSGEKKQRGEYSSIGPRIRNNAENVGAFIQIARSFIKESVRRPHFFLLPVSPFPSLPGQPALPPALSPPRRGRRNNKKVDI